MPNAASTHVAPDPHLDRLITLAFEEDIGPGDVTTRACIDPATMAHAKVVAKEPLVLAGVEAFRRVFEKTDPRVVVEALVDEGQAVEKGTIVLRIDGPAWALLEGERVALNFLQRLSGIATKAKDMSAPLQGTKTRLLDTRKTTPGWRRLEKAAVRAGGGHNHRGGLFDGAMLKENHIAAAGGITAAVEKVRDQLHHLIKVEVETTNLEEVQEALDCKADVIMLDNMDNATTAEAMKLVDAHEKKTHFRPKIEASGNMTKERLASVAALGVDFISAGAITHSARGMDLSMLLTLEPPSV